MRGRKWIGLVCAMCVVVALGGCGGSGSATGPGQNPTLVDQGWSAFEAGDFVGAKSDFEQAVAEDSTSSAARNGLGWADMMLGNLPDAVESFDRALADGFTGADPHAGKAILLRDLDPVDYGAAIASAGAALAIDSAYAFTHDTDLDWKDLRLILAQSHFALGEYVEANAQVGELGGAVQDPDSTTFVESLLAEIDRLGEVIEG